MPGPRPTLETWLRFRALATPSVPHRWSLAAMLPVAVVTVVTAVIALIGG